MTDSLTDIEIIPKFILQHGLKKGFIYSGSSMKPTFRPGQVLYVRPNVQDIQRGDVLVYKQHERFIVHRVLFTGTTGYITRGDNNRLVDVAPIPPDMVVGRVELAERQGAVSRVLGGRRGLLSARLHWVVMRLSSWFRYLFGWPYRFIKRNRILVGLWAPKFVTICLQTENGPLYKYIYHRKTIATWNPQSDAFQCRKPFDLVIFPQEVEHAPPIRQATK